MTSSLPLYVDIEGRNDASVMPPGVFCGTSSWTFAVCADRDKLQALAQRLISDPTGGEWQVCVPAGLVLMIFFNEDSLNSPAQPIGWTPNQEFVCSIPVLLQSKSDPLKVHIGLLPPWVYIDNARGMVTGRESWGYFKNLGTISAPKEWSSDFCCSLDTLTFTPVAPSTEGEVTRLVTVEPIYEVTDPPTHIPGLPPAQHATIVELLRRHVEEDALELFEKAVMALEPFAITVFNLKQFRDVTDPTRACFQAITTSPLQVTKIESMHLLPQGLGVTIEACGSEQMAQLLGICDCPAKVLFGIGAELEYSAISGATLWQARTGC